MQLQRAIHALQTHRSSWFRITVGILFLIAVLSLGCSHDKDDDDDDDDDSQVQDPSTTSRRLDVDAEDTIVDEMVEAGERADFVYTLSSPSQEGPFDAMTLDLKDTLMSLTVSSPLPLTRAPEGVEAPAAVAGATAQLTVRFSDVDDEFEVCSSGYVYGPFTIPLDGTSDPDPETVDATPATVEILNVGDASICISVVPTEPVVLTLASIAVDVEECDVEAEDIEGRWEGDFSCTNSCGAGFEGTVEIDIEQDGFNARYDDGDGFFRGIVCGSRFRFSGGYECDELVCDEIEAGTFTKTGENDAEKTSEYQYFDVALGQVCEGTCSDTLERVP